MAIVFFTEAVRSLPTFDLFVGLLPSVFRFVSEQKGLRVRLIHREGWNEGCYILPAVLISDRGSWTLKRRGVGAMSKISRNDIFWFADLLGVGAAHFVFFD